MSPKGFTLSVKVEIEKKHFDLPQVLINDELYGLVLAPRLKKGYHPLWEANLQSLGSMF